MIKRLLWLDDYRDPFDRKMDWIAFSPIGRNVEIHWVINYQEFVDYIMAYGLPDGICFDHDLGDFYDGYDCSKWLVNYCLDRNIKTLPKYSIQSANTVGKENIDKLLKSYSRFFK